HVSGSRRRKLELTPEELNCRSLAVVAGEYQATCTFVPGEPPIQRPCHGLRLFTPTVLVVQIVRQRDRRHGPPHAAGERAIGRFERKNRQAEERSDDHRGAELGDGRETPPRALRAQAFDQQAAGHEQRWERRREVVRLTLQRELYEKYREK